MEWKQGVSDVLQRGRHVMRIGRDPHKLFDGAENDHGWASNELPVLFEDGGQVPALQLA